MKLKVLGSGSSGNCYLLETEAECLVIEAGLPFREVKKALDFNVKKIKAVIITHIHSDHHLNWFQFARAGIPIFEPFRNDGQTLEFDNSQFVIRAFPNQDKDGKWLHGNSDGTECPCYGYYIYHPEIGNLVYVTDTEYVRWRFSNVNHILVEANHSKELIDRDSAKFEHQITGHMEIETTCDFLGANKSPQLRNVILCHLSGDCADADVFIEKARKVVDCPVFIAGRGLEVDLNLLPF